MPDCSMTCMMALRCHVRCSRPRCSRSACTGLRSLAGWLCDALVVTCIRPLCMMRVLVIIYVLGAVSLFLCVCRGHGCRVQPSQPTLPPLSRVRDGSAMPSSLFLFGEHDGSTMPLSSIAFVFLAWGAPSLSFTGWALILLRPGCFCGCRCC